MLTELVEDMERFTELEVEELEVEELVELSDRALADRIEALELRRRATEAKLATAVAIATKRNLAAADGHRSMAAYLRASLNWSTTEANRFLGLSRAVDNVAGFGSAWCAGRFGIPQAIAFSKAYGNPRVRGRLPEFAPLLLEHAEQLPYSDFTAALDHFVAQADADGAHDDRDGNVEGRSAAVLAVGSSLHITASGGDALTTAEMIAIHERYCDREYEQDLDVRRSRYGADAEHHELARTAKQRRFDALIAIFRAAAASDGVGDAADPLVNIEVDARSFGRILIDAGLATSTDLDGNPIDPFTGLSDPVDLLDDPTALLHARCETSNGVQLHPHDVLRAALAGHVRRAVIDSDGVTIDLGRKQRLFTGYTRDAARLMVRHCEHPGCELPADWCDVDHAAEWVADDGSTDQANARIRCGVHNREKHRRRWRTRRATNGHTYTVRGDGTIMLPAGARSPTFAGPDDDTDLDDPAEIARLTLLARRRVAALRVASASGHTRAADASSSPPVGRRIE
jgi:hypothetical protein